MAVPFSAEREQQFARRSRRIDGSTETHTLTRLLEKFTNEKPKHSTSTACSFPGRITRKEPRHEPLEHGARSPRGSREGRSGSDSKGVCWSMGSLSKRSPRRWSFKGLILVCLSVACRAYMPQSPETQKKYTSRWSILGLVQAARGDVPGNMLAERGANKSDGWGLGSSAAEWLILSAGGELLRPKAGTRSALRRAVSSARTRKVSSVQCVPSDQQEGPKAEMRSVPRKAVSSARTWKLSSVWYVSGDQQERPLPSHCYCGRRCRRKGAPSIEKPPEKEQGLWARWEAKAKSLRKKNRRDWRNAATIASQASRRHM